MADQEQYKVEQILKDFRNLDSAKELFSELNYDIARDSLSRRDWGTIATEALAEDPQVIATHNDFRVIYSRPSSNRLRITQQRAVVNTLLREHPYALFLFSTEDQNLWHFVNVKLASGERDDERNKESKKRRLFRRITIRENERRLRTATQRLSMLDLALIQPELFDGIPPLEIQKQHDKAFDVEEVTKEFYKAYEERFDGLKANLNKQTGEHRWAHDFALQFLNRLMFLYFVQRKGWLADDDEFLETFWTAYSKSNEPKDTFFEKWLKVLFFEAFNNQKNLLNTNQRAYMPEQIRKALWEAPYLNGGLFKENELDNPAVAFQISDRQFTKIFNLFQRYNFTITEDSPLDQEVAVDPEMIGKVYESLVNLTETGMERSAAGIFYTPRTEIDLMCRLSIVDNLTNHLGQQHKNIFYEMVFSFDQEDKEQADKTLVEANLWPDVERRLNEITVLDPACGSGSFLVGMLYILNDLLERAEKQRGQVAGSYERKKRIIGQSLYGVDTMDWACHVAELRLWLALIVDAEFGKEELMIRKEPLLPHFSFKVRCGDSLVQEVGGIDMAHRRGIMEISPNIKRKLTELKNEKGKFYSNDVTCKFKSPEALESYEVLIFKELLQDRVNQLQNESKDLMRRQEELKVHRQMTLTGELEGAAEQLTLKHEEFEQQIKAKMDEKQQVEMVVNSIRDRTTVPFVWDIAFAGIFSSDSHGFDIVIGNPPYVRQEKIADPKLSQEEITVENKKEYKAKLARSVYKEYPRFFGYKVATDKASHKISAKSDLYIYFYFHGLSLLNNNGSFCFITSNSWLDVGYGKDLQEFLLKRCHTKLVIDNKTKRSFKEVDINTIIALFGPPEDSKVTDEVSIDKMARFVMFNVPFEEVLHPVVFEEIQEAEQKTTVPEYRIFPIKQSELLIDGCEPTEASEGQLAATVPIRTGKYIGSKWGGKYLRAPDVYWKILERASDNLVPLGKIAKIRRGLTTGANDFFFLPNKHFDISKSGSYYELRPKSDGLPDNLAIECEFLKPAVLRLIHVTRAVLFKEEVSHYCLVISHDRKLRATESVVKYIRWGEERGYNNSQTCRSRSPWYTLREITPPPLMVPRRHKRRPVVLLNSCEAIASDGLVFIYPHDFTHTSLCAASIFTTFNLLQREIIGSANFGQGVLETQKGVVPDFLVVDPNRSVVRKNEKLILAFQNASKRPIQMIYDDVRQDERITLDDAFLEILGFDESKERTYILKELHDELCRIVWDRMAKTQNSREDRQTYDNWFKSGEPFGLDIVEDI